jgi:hypothetical protein
MLLELNGCEFKMGLKFSLLCAFLQTQSITQEKQAVCGQLELTKVESCLNEYDELSDGPKS